MSLDESTSGSLCFRSLLSSVLPSMSTTAGGLSRFSNRLPVLLLVPANTAKSRLVQKKPKAAKSCSAC